MWNSVMKVWEQDVTEGIFLERPNRFVVHASIDGRIQVCHMPNPGRLRELLFPGVKLYALPTPQNHTAYRIVGIEREGTVIFLDTARANDVAEKLVCCRRIPGWERCRVVRREVTMGDSRFDLLLTDEKTGETFPVEVKSCTLFGERGAMFPDAVTARGRKHILHLKDIGLNSRAGLLILVHWGKAEWFLPDYHTDPEFAMAFVDAFPYLDCKIAAVSWTKEFLMPETVRLLPTRTDIVKRECQNGGDYLLVLEAETDMDIDVGSLGCVHIPKGYYVYVGSAKKNLVQRINRHRRLRKGMHWHVDYLRRQCRFAGVVSVRTTHDWEHKMAEAVSCICGWSIPRFGCTDCSCETHLFGFADNPLYSPAFTKLEEDFAINRLDGYFRQ